MSSLFEHGTSIPQNMDCNDLWLVGSGLQNLTFLATDSTGKIIGGTGSIAGVTGSTGSTGATGAGGLSLGVTGGTGVSIIYSGQTGTISIGQAVNTTSNVKFAGVTGATGTFSQMKLISASTGTGVNALLDISNTGSTADLINVSSSSAGTVFVANAGGSCYGAENTFDDGAGNMTVFANGSFNTITNTAGIGGRTDGGTPSAGQIGQVVLATSNSWASVLNTWTNSGIVYTIPSKGVWLIFTFASTAYSTDINSQVSIIMSTSSSSGNNANVLGGALDFSAYNNTTNELGCGQNMVNYFICTTANTHLYLDSYAIGFNSSNPTLSVTGTANTGYSSFAVRIA